MPICIILFLAFFISACEMPKFNIPSHDKDTEESNLDDEFKEKEIDESRPSSTQIKAMNSNKQRQDPDKSFDQDKGQVISGSPKHPFPSENPFK